jgi:23S rRNA (cytosine1962-C5)-methyltransferase
MPSERRFPNLEAIPPKSERNVTLRVDRSGERALRKRHPWLFADGIREQSHEGRTGDHAVVFDRGRSFLAIGLWDPHSPIRVRVLHSGKPAPIDAGFFADRIGALAERRKPLLGRETDGYRVVNGENEGLPGLVVDRYADTLVVEIFTPAWLPHLSLVLGAILDAVPAERVVLRLSRETARRESELHGLRDGMTLFGSPAEGPIVFRENGLRFECDPVHGQKTGFFLDQRDNRARVEAISKGKEVLNVFAYTGGFSVYAARGGAKHVTSVDQSGPALAAAERNFALNRKEASVEHCPHEAVSGDAFDVLNEMGRSGRRFDLVIIDPPSFARRQSERERALGAYARLVDLGLAVLRRGGDLVIASCSARIGAEEFYGLVHRTAHEAGRPLTEVERTGHAMDHPIGFPEGEYLKCLFAKDRK